MFVKAAGAAAAALVLIILLIGAAAAAAVSALLGGGSSSTPSTAAINDIPADYLALYQRAAIACPGLDWAILAAIGKIESDHGRSTLPGVTVGENRSGAAGPMQFLKPTFDSVIAGHPIPPGGANPPSRYHPHDAVHAAAFYLCDSGAQHDLRRALHSYNNSDTYASSVLTLAAHYGATPASRTGQLTLDWPPEVATVADPTSGGRITPRTLTLLRALQNNAMTGDSTGCFAHRPANPDSDHPKGRACDIMINPHDPQAVAHGWAIANWLITNQARYGINYLIWQGQYWSAREPRWTPYRSGNYGCPNPANITGCHYDHIHVSVY